MHEVTGHDDVWEYAITEDDRDKPVLHPPGEGWVQNTGTGQPQNGSNWIDLRDGSGTCRRYYWKRPIAYATMNREAAVIAATDPTTIALEARNQQVTDLNHRVCEQMKEIEQLIKDRDSYKRVAGHNAKLNSDRYSELQQIKKIVGGPHLAYVNEGATALKLVTELVDAHSTANKMITDLEGFLKSAVEEGKDYRERNNRLLEENKTWRDGHLKLEMEMVDLKAIRNDRIASLTSDLVIANDTIKILEEREAKNLSRPMRPVPMFLTCPMCNTRHIDEGEFATRSHHTHACQTCGLTWRPAIVPTVGVQYLPGFKNEEK